MESSSSNPDQVSNSKHPVLPTEDIEIKETTPKKTPDADSLYEEGMTLLKQDNTEQSIEKFCKALELATQARGDLHESLYKFYYSYADALIMQYEKEQDGNIFGDAVPKEVPISESESGIESADESRKDSEAQKVAETVENNEKTQSLVEEGEDSYSGSEEEEGSEESGESGEDEESGENEENEEVGKKNDQVIEEKMEIIQNNEESDDLQIAWENLDTARVILKNLNPPDYYSLFKVQSRLGDLQSFKENYEGACEEYFEALNTLKRLEGLKPSRDQASIHYLIGLNFLYSKNKELEAAEHFKQSYAILESVLLINKDQETEEQLKAVMEDLKIKIEDALEQKESVEILSKTEVTQLNQFDPPQVAGVVDLGVVQRKKLPPQGDPDFPDNNDDKKTAN